MSNSGVIRSRYSKKEIISVMQGVAAVMGSRKEKAHYSTETNKATLQAAFIEEQCSSIDDELSILNKEIEQAEITAKEPSDTMLKLRSAKRTLTNEFARFTEVEKTSRSIVKGKNRDTINTLLEDIEKIEERSIPYAENQYEIAKQKQQGLKERKENLFISLGKLHADFLSVKKSVIDDQEQCLGKLNALNQENEGLENRFSNELTSRNSELIDEEQSLNETIEEKKKEQKILQDELKKFQNTKSRIDSLDDPGEYINDLSKQLEENKLSLEAKNKIIDTVRGINQEVGEIVNNITDGIDDYKSIMAEFETTLNDTIDIQQI